MPSFLSKIEYCATKVIDFTPPCTKKKRYDCLSSAQLQEQGQQTQQVSVIAPDDNETSSFFESLSQCGTNPAVLSLLPRYSDRFVPKSVLPHYPAPLQSLHKPEYMELAYHELLNLCSSQEVSTTKEQEVLVERATKCQSKSKLWFKYRAGNITASQMKSVCHTNASSPSQSLLKSICYPEAYSFTSKQTV